MIWLASETFVAATFKEALENCTIEQFLETAEHYSVVLEDKCLKENIKVALKKKTG